MLPAAPGYVTQLPPERASARLERRRRVALRRAGPAIIVHRGAAAFAPENTLEAYAAALDYGADGCEVDIRRTADGVLVLFHDDMLDSLTTGFGTVEEATYYELLSLRPRRVYGTATAQTRPPTLAALLELVRRRAMLLHLDIKRPGLDGQIAALLDAAGVWDHVVAVNRDTAPGLARDPRVRLLAYKGPGLYEGRHDLDPTAVRAQLQRPGQLVMVDDPRVAAQVLGREPVAHVPLPTGLRAEWPARFSRPRPQPLGEWPVCLAGPAGEFPHFARSWRDWLTAVPALADVTPTEKIVACAVAIQRLGEPAKISGNDVRKLEQRVWERSLHADWMFHGLDGAQAARVLGKHGCVGAAPLLVRAYRRADPALRRVQDPRFAANPLAWTDFRVKMAVLPALGRLRCRSSREFLREYVALPEARARELAPLQYEEATRGLLNQDLPRAEIEQLLRSGNLAVRGAAILTCVDEPAPVRTAALRGAVPWASSLPSAAGAAE